MSLILAKLRDELSKAEESRRSIASVTGISEALLCRFLSGERELGIRTAERLADYFGMRMVLQPKRATKRKRG